MLTSVTISDSVTSIEKGTFEGCSGLTSVTIPDGVTSIGECAFFGCSELTSVTIPNSVTSIGERAFSDCVKLAEIYNLSHLDIKKGDRSYGAIGFYAITIYNKIQESKLLTDKNGYMTYSEGENIVLYGYGGTDIELTLPNGITEIHDSAFNNNSKLKSVTIPDSVTSIGNRAFFGCSGLTSVTISDSVTSIGEYAFSGCSGLTSVTIPGSVTSIGYKAFAGCRNLENITIPGSIKRIRESVFENCEKLSTVDIRYGVADIAAKAFVECQALKTITIPRSVKKIGNNAFINNKYLVIRGIKGSDIEKYAIANKFKFEAIEMVEELPKKTETVSSKAPVFARFDDLYEDILEEVNWRKEYSTPACEDGFIRGELHEIDDNKLKELCEYAVNIAGENIHFGPNELYDDIKQIILSKGYDGWYISADNVVSPLVLLVYLETYGIITDVKIEFSHDKYERNQDYSHKWWAGFGYSKKEKKVIVKLYLHRAYSRF